MHTLALEKLVQQAPGVSFVHNFPGAVYTNLHTHTDGFLGLVVRVTVTALHVLLGRWLFVPIEESGERQVFFATSARYPAHDGSATGVLQIGEGAARGSDGKAHSGVYSVGWDGEGPSSGAEIALKGLRKKSIQDLVWNHFVEQFENASKSATKPT